MSIQKMIDIHEEFQAILSLVGRTRTIVEDLENIEINLEDNITLELLKKINAVVSQFGIYCNPFSSDCNEIILEIEQGILEIEEIESISINIDKKSILNEDSNLHYYFLDINSALNSLVFIGKQGDSCKINIGIPFYESVETELLNIITLNAETDLAQIEKKAIKNNIDESIKLYLSYNKKGNHNYHYNPYTFVISNASTTHKLIQRHFYQTTLDFLSDKSNNDKYIIRGEKTVNVRKSEDFTTENYEDIVWILFYLISEEKYMEKYLISKKVFSYYIIENMDLSGLDDKMPNIRKTIRHYYNHYIEDDIKDFFKTKDQLLKEAMSVSKVIYEQTDKVNTSITASLLSVILLLVTTLYGVIESITVVHLLAILLVFLIFSLFYYRLIKKSSIKRYSLAKAQFMYFINEISLIKDSEVFALKKVYLNDPFEELDRTIRKLFNVLFTINYVLFLVFIIMLYVKGYINIPYPR